MIIFDGFGDSAINLKLAVWAESSEWLTMRNEMYEAIKKRFDEEGIEIPFPHRTIYFDADTKPMSVEISKTSHQSEVPG